MEYDRRADKINRIATRKTREKKTKAKIEQKITYANAERKPRRCAEYNVNHSLFSMLD